MMHEELYQYLLLYKQLNVPGIGTFLLERKPAVADFPGKQIMAPVYAVTLQPDAVSPPRHFFNWLSAALKITGRDAVIRFNDFVFELKQQLSSGSSIEWVGVGRLSTGLAGEIRFEPTATVTAHNFPVAAEKIIREKAEHSVRVGEEEKTSAEMREWLSHTETQRSYWWTWALAAGILLIIFTGWYFSQHGLSSSSTGNTQKIKPAETTATYRQVS